VREWIDHTSELELRIHAATPEEVFAEAMDALGELLEDGTSELRESMPRSRREIAVSAPDRATLLVEWLNELVFLAEARRFLPRQLDAITLGEAGLDAVVTGVAGIPRPLVKAVTYHRLELEESEGTWRARVIFDV
jgi:SHS2 domain-containing protein